MTLLEKGLFINELVENIRSDIIDNYLSKLPEEWDGHELRRRFEDQL